MKAFLLASVSMFIAISKETVDGSCLLVVSSSSHSPARSLGITTLGGIFPYVIVFFNPTIEVVTFSLRGLLVV